MDRTVKNNFEKTCLADAAEGKIDSQFDVARTVVQVGRKFPCGELPYPWEFVTTE